MDRGRKKAKKHRQDERVCWSLVMWLQTHRVSASAWPSVGFPHAGSGAFPPGDKLFLQNKEIIRKMTAGPADRKPRGLSLRELPPSISWLHLASPSFPLEKVKHPTPKRFPSRAVLTMSSSVSLLIFLFFHL